MSKSLSQIEQTPVLLLVGGMGTRLKSVVPNAPKPLAKVGDHSFLELLVRQVKHHGFRQLVMCTGHLAEQVEREFGDGRRFGLQIEYSKEASPLGTGGALKLAQQFLGNRDTCLVMNGDSFIETDFDELIKFHRNHGGVATIAAVKVANGSRYGRILIDEDGKIRGFQEKTGEPNPAIVNGGVYVFSSAVFDHIPNGACSLEKDIFPRLIAEGFYARVQNGMFIDIGTPQDYARAQELCDQLYGAALGNASESLDRM